MMDAKDVTLEQVIELMDKRYTLIYVDQGDGLDNNLDKVAEAIRKQDWQPLDELYEDWNMYEQEWDSIDYILKELADEVERTFDITEEEAEGIIEEYKDNLRDVIYDRDDSTFMKDLIRQTSDPVMFYDTGVEIYNGCLSSREELKDLLKDVKKALKIKLSDTKYDDRLEMMIQQGDNGRLVIYFNADINHMMSIGDKNIVTFTSPNVALIDTWNGAGDHCQLNGYEFTIPFNIENFFMDKEIKYSYTYQVCGMYSSWCDGTGIKFGKRKVKTPKGSGLSSTLHQDKEYEKKCDETFKKGGCTPMDMDMRRHRGTYYLNEFPCGTHCPHCHTFWID